jgi:hypothetical protein
MTNNTPTYCYTEEEMQRALSAVDACKQELADCKLDLHAATVTIWAIVTAVGGRVEVADTYFVKAMDSTLVKERTNEGFTVFKALKNE